MRQVCHVVPSRNDTVISMYLKYIVILSDSEEPFRMLPDVRIIDASYFSMTMLIFSGRSLRVRLSAHTTQALGARPVPASILNASFVNRRVNSPDYAALVALSSASGKEG